MRRCIFLGRGLDRYGKVRLNQRHWTYLSLHRVCQSRPCASACQKRPIDVNQNSARYFSFIRFLFSEKPLNRLFSTLPGRNHKHASARLQAPLPSTALFRIPAQGRIGIAQAAIRYALRIKCCNLFQSAASLTTVGKAGSTITANCAIPSNAVRTSLPLISSEGTAKGPQKLRKTNVQFCSLTFRRSTTMRPLLE